MSVTFYVCPSDRSYWSPAGRALMDAAPADRVNGGPRQCPDCSRSQARRDDERADARSEAGL